MNYTANEKKKEKSSKTNYITKKRKQNTNVTAIPDL